MEPDVTEHRTDVASRSILVVAGAYNLLWGAAVIAFPAWAFSLFGFESPPYPEIWQCLGMIVGVYGVGYLIASSNPSRHWALVFVGLLGKILGPVGFAYSALNNALPWSWGWIILFNDLIWWIPFGYVLYMAAKKNSDSSFAKPYELDDAIALFPSHHGQTLLELSNESPLMIVFLRHFGCSFCREALDDLRQVRSRIEELGFNIALVHMSLPDDAESMLDRYQLRGVHYFCDVQCDFYRAFGLKRGTASQLFGPRLWPRAISAISQGHTVGRLAGDGFRMPGVFFLYRGEIWSSFRHQTAADRPDYLELANQVKNILDAESVPS
ncbi:SelL-related redox protein [Aeoliella sp. ICT_H6.2]|uniref:SelL-related redox protein n=1 Tax=Aeoliella straminimaris TaxID=2954799 RepID=A0A9X2F9M7_9BACT|nr:SelL-related redox protein [Aeoliella straminimaris]MCO6044183.1 SelL-related redox protein [Aeoliella straminimaris]